MNIQQHAEVKQLFLNILSDQPKNKTNYLLEHTSDKDVIDQVLYLLSTYENNTQHTREFVEDIAENISQSALIFPSDRYVLIEKIGQGGMGDVYLAQRKVEGIKQKVAIKILHKSDHMSQERFLQEAAILSQLSHPHISQFIDADFLNDGRPYVVMEYTKGKTITEYCQTIKADINTRLGLFMNLCEAVQHAHRNLIIHRDIKPDNIIVNSNGQLKLLDFGIAKIMQHDANIKTHTQMHIMTPAYASPEQYLGEPVNVSSDVYSLGVVFYELLSGVRPYETKRYSPIEYEKTLRNKKIEKPSKRVLKLSKNDTVDVMRDKKSSWSKRLSGDIDTILSKSLKYDADERYQTVAELMDDVYRHQHNLPILAKKHSLAYRGLKWVKRKKLPLSIFCAFMVLIATFMQSFIQQRDIAIQQQKNAEAITDVLIQSFNNADPTQNLGQEVKALDILNQATRLLINDEKNQSLFTETLAIKIAEVFYNLGEYKESENIIGLIENKYDSLPQDNKLAYINTLVKLFIKDDKYSQAAQLIDEGLDLFPNSTQLKLSKAQLLGNESKLKEAQSYLDNVFADMSVNDDMYFPICNELGRSMMSAGERDKALKLLISCESSGGSLQNNTLNHALLLRTLATVQRAQGLYIESSDNYIRSLNQLEHIYGEEHIVVGYAHSFLGSNYLLQNINDKALEHLQKSLEIKESAYGVGHQQTASAYYNLANVHDNMKNYTLARFNYQKAIDLMLDNGVKNSVRLAFFYKYLARATYQLKDFQSTEEALKNSIEIFEDKGGTYVYRAAEVQVHLAQVYYDQGDFEAAKALIEIALPNMYVMHKKGDEYQVMAEKLDTLLKEIE